MAQPSYEPLDDALELLSGVGSAVANGNFNHAPMVAEALCALGRPEAVLPWLERYRARLMPRGIAGETIAADRWRDALGRRGSFAAWCDFFAAELAEARWCDVLDRWAMRLAPGFSAAATHGPIRVGHAVRALGDGETPARRRELGEALASWAANYRELPMASGPAPVTLRPHDALLRVPIVPPQRRRPGNIATALAGLDDFPEFAAAVGWPDPGGDRDGLFAELTELFARVYLAGAGSVLTTIALIHGVTSLAAIGHIAPLVQQATGQALLRYGWQAGCGLYACFGGGIADTIAGDEEEAATLIDRAIANGDEHVIKFTEACLSRCARAPSPAYQAAAAHARRMLGAR